MEINNFNEKFFEIGQKYSFNKIDQNGDGLLSEDEVLSLIEKDEEIKAELIEKNDTDNSISSDTSEITSESVANKFDYEKIKKNYMEYINKLNSGDLEEEAKKSYEYNQNYTASDSDSRKFTEEAIYLQMKDDLYNSIILKTVTPDLNYDGKIDAKDLALFSNNVDLDDDGMVSDEEKMFLGHIKERLIKTVYKNAINTNNIDTLIESLDILGEDGVSEVKEITLKNLVTQKALSYTDGYTEVILSDDSITGPRWHSNILASYPDSIKDGLLTKEQYRGTTIGEMKKILENIVDYYNPSNSYNRYIKNAKLSKAELEDILNKINSASPSVQNQLADIKYTVQQKLSCME